MAEEELAQTALHEILLLDLVLSEPVLQIALVELIIALTVIGIVNYRFSWLSKRKISYVRPHISLFFQKIIFPSIAIAIIIYTRIKIQIFELITNPDALQAAIASEELTSVEYLIKILNTAAIILVGYVIAHLVQIFLNRHNRLTLERQDFESWKEKLGFDDDKDDIFHKFFEWIPPQMAPDEIPEDEFKEKLQTSEGRNFLEEYRNAKGQTIGTYKQIIKNGFSQWKKLDRKKYEKYYDACISGNNKSGLKLRPGVYPPEIYPITRWAEVRRINGYDPVTPGSKSPGYSIQKLQNIPKSFTNFIPITIFLAIALGVVSWWGIDLIVLATAVGGLSIGVGFALQETMSNYFAYIYIRKDRIFVEGDRIQLENGYNGFVDRITPRVTYLRHGLNESIAIVPTKMLTSAVVTSFSKDTKFVPARLRVGVSYLNDPDQVSAILVKVGQQAMKEITDKQRRHLIVQEMCPNRKEHRPSCGCDKEIIVDVEQPTVRFRDFSDSALSFEMWVYARDYGSQFKILSEVRRMIFKEFKNYKIKIPWTIRTVYPGDQEKETEEIGKLDEERKKELEKYGLGNLD